MCGKMVMSAGACHEGVGFFNTVKHRIKKQRMLAWMMVLSLVQPVGIP